MNPQSGDDWENQVTKLEQQVEKSSVVTSIRNWFENLSTPAKVVVAVVSLFVGFSILNIFLKVVASLLTVAILGIILYLLYRFLNTAKPS